jgi:aminopeptidase N
MLRQNLGEDNWWRAINYYLRKYANQPVETEQLRIAIEESTGQAMDWFFDEWLYRMGHPIFRVTQNYNQVTRALTLEVEQLQTPDSASQFPQVAYFQAPVEIEIGTATGTRLERVQILPQRNQSFTFSLASKPLLVNFDFRSTLIKELEFAKSTDDLTYQLTHDEDVLGRVWAMKQLAERASAPATDALEKQRINSQLANAATQDKFWGVRLEAASALGNLNSATGRNALIAATTDTDARVRARAVKSLGQSNDPALAALYEKLLSDESYAVIRAAALMLGQTHAQGAYEALEKLLQVNSWRDNIRISALAGMEALEDKRARRAAVRFAARGNPPLLRAAAFRLLRRVGDKDPKTFSLTGSG